jgi:hypothetical protein
LPIGGTDAGLEDLAVNNEQPIAEVARSSTTSGHNRA